MSIASTLLRSHKLYLLTNCLTISQNREALHTLEDSIEFASKILDIDTTNVQPLYTVLENQPLKLREDTITDGNIQADILRNARVTEEEYFVAPPGNIPLDQSDNNSRNA